TGRGLPQRDKWGAAHRDLPAVHYQGWRAALTDIARLRQRIQRRKPRAQVPPEPRAHRRARRARQGVDHLRQQAMRAGAAAANAWEVTHTGEARALRLARTRTAALAALLPVLLAFGARSAAGVQAGMVTLLSLQPGSVAAA